MDRIKYNANGDATSFEGRGAVEVFRAAALASGLRLYAKTGMKPNRAWTPTAMSRAAFEVLGDHAKGVSRRDYNRLADLLSQWVEREKARIASQEGGNDHA